MLCCRLRRADADAADGPVVELAPIVAQIRQRWPDTKILVRGHSGFCCKHIMAWCERRVSIMCSGLVTEAVDGDALQTCRAGESLESAAGKWLRWRWGFLAVQTRARE